MIEKMNQSYRTHVVEVLRISDHPESSRSENSEGPNCSSGSRCISSGRFRGAPDAAELFGSRLAHFRRFYQSLETTWGPGVDFQEYAIECLRGVLDPNDFSGEYLRLRRVESCEIFDSTCGVLLLDREKLTVLCGELAQEIFAELHGQETAFDDLAARLFEAAFDLLFQHLREDFNTCLPNQSTDTLVEAVTDALRGRDLMGLDRTNVLALSDDIIQLVSERLLPER